MSDALIAKELDLLRFADTWRNLSWMTYRGVFEMAKRLARNSRKRASHD